MLITSEEVGESVGFHGECKAEQGGCAEGGLTELDPNCLTSDQPLHLHEPSFPRRPNGANKTRESGEKETLLS